MKTRFVNSPITPDYAYVDPVFGANAIASQRDLEDYARLWICGLPALPSSNGYSVSLGWSVISGNPGINLVRSVETNGGTGYLTDTNIALLQVSGANGYKFGYVGTVTPYVFPPDFFATNGTKYLLFEGVSAGKGALTLTVSQGTHTIAQTSAYLDLHDVRDFYERAVITNNTSGAVSNWSSAIETAQQATSSALGDDTNIIVLVHGINVSVSDWLIQSDTVFKRLFWAGYRGKFATVKWSCEYLNLWAAVEADTSVFNRSEAKAYKSGVALKTYLDGLRTRFPDYQLNLLAHSQGNAVAGEAIRQGASVDTYILTQGAIPASAYDIKSPINTQLFEAEYIYATPESQPMGYKGIYTNFTGRIANFYNPNDPVLAVWIADQAAGKPDGYLKDIVFPNNFYTYDGTNGHWNNGLTFSSYVVTDSQESRAMISRSLTLSIGQSGPASPHGVIQSAVNLNTQFGFNNAFPGDHSAQWVWPIQTVLPYYQQIIPIIQPAQ